MFAKKAATPQPDTIQQLAQKLGVERRRHARVVYPLLTTGPLPAVEYFGRRVRVEDLSVGGCCINDPQERLGKDVGIELTLTLLFPDGAEDVRCRLVGRVDHRRHIQFLDLPPVRAGHIAQTVMPGVCGAGLSRTMKAQPEGPQLAAREVWMSLIGDGIVLEDDVHRLAQIMLAGQNYTVYHGAWPTGPDRERLSHAELLKLILFVANVRHPSPGISKLLSELETLSLEAR